MESLDTKKHVTEYTDDRRKPIGRGAHALSQALNRLVEEGVVPRQQLTDRLGQFTVYLNQAFHAVSVLQSSARAMMGTLPQDNDSPWDWFLLHQDEEIRCGVIAVNPYRPVPVHDHTSTGGILLVLEGHLVERCFGLDASSEAATGLVRLVPGETRYLDAGQWSVHSPDWNSLHSLAATSRPAMALSIQFNPSNDVRSWFLTTGEDTGNVIYAMRAHQAMLKHRTS